ncbi:unnamed protein product [Peronospora destructor]|uniref:Mediator of RNA polymerase II transcription subunit 7 n=1 Tax=Peronospora destructor TaxID=86335 RepID=A0AAV0TE87_9STRA|nr:unnamed protein product [Peronospora destructor]
MGTEQDQQEDAPEIVSEFPAPPRFFALYAEGPTCGPTPPKPMEPTYHMFGSPYSTLDVVPDLLQPGKKLYAPERDDADVLMDYKAQMKKINHSLLANFVELIDVLIKKPSLFNEKLDDMELLFLNMHNLINAFRPHQARETVIQILKTQVQDRKNASTDDVAAVDGISPAEIDDDVKMENADGSGVVGNGGGRTNVSGAVGALMPTPVQQEQEQKACEARRMQEQFFSALEAAMN